MRYVIWGLWDFFFNIQVKQKKVEIFISREKYADDLSKKVNMPNCKFMPTPMGMNEKLNSDKLVNK